ncbi:two pore calcium channel protein 1-like [Myxocyprinus asiaticus]|uniref:two pore calcium channel protein 1-like n=1 Tax=Myxocyprinus asiaticus TaxID=70543 RepID=UPI002222B68D|nr:two pore calcium channel protein 1-like [Myxocyprinus asiaticus]XP_051528013.1 two pore calcium channel protein 1-like [Myxocyprinus asiaticus]XP_051528014.1 two pore calcium channel protein 1-like [Myxocyprinus asiaticus]
MSEQEKTKKTVDHSLSKDKVLSNGGNNVSEKMTEKFQLASVYVSDAQYNRNIFFDTSPQAVRLYLLYNHWFMQMLVYVFIIMNLALALFEDPAVVPVPIWATSSVEIICLSAFTVRLVHYAKVIPKDKFWKDPKNICIIIIITLSFTDLTIYWALKATGNFGIRWSRVLRPLLLVNVTEGRQLRRAFRSIRNALPQIFYVFLLFMFSVLVFSLMALKLFRKRGLLTNDGSPYFNDYLDIVFDLYVLVTTANSPDIMMPAYNYSVYFTIFFILYIVVNTYTFMSFFLAVVYNNYKKYLKEEVRQLVKARRFKMCRAFSVLQETLGDGGEPVVTQPKWNHLVKLVKPNISDAHRELLWSVLDDQNKGHIGKLAFVQLADLLSIQVITVRSQTHPMQICFPSVYNSSASRFIRCMVRHRMFVYVYDLIILVNAVFIGLDEENPVVSNAEWGFLALYMLEIILKLYSTEPRMFFARHQFWNWFDTTIVVSALFGTIINSALKQSGGYTSRQILDIVFILRVLRLVRLVDSIKRFRAIINTLIKIGPTILTFGQLILVVYYIFAMVGMELFKGKVQFFEPNSTSPDQEYCGNPLLKGTNFAKYNYCKNNFNNVISSFIVLLELTVVNQWHVLTNGFTAVTHVSARIFFVIFHIVVVIIIINIFVAFILEAFLVEYTVDKSDLQTFMEKKIEELELSVQQDVVDGGLVDAMESSDNDLGVSESGKQKPSLMFKIASRRSRTVDGLLQRMFEADLRPEDYNEDVEPENMNFSNPVFDSI